MTATDESLAKAAAAGDAHAFSALLNRHYDRIFRLAFRLTGAKADAEDLCQDICAALPAKITRYSGGARFTTWLYRVVVNAGHDRRRRQESYANATTGWGDVERARQAEADEASQARDWLASAMQALPEDIRDTLALVLDDVTHKDAANILGISEGTVSWRIAEAKKRLKQLKERDA